MSQLHIAPLSQGFGAEITGFDMQAGRDPADIATLRRAYDDYQLLIFPDCDRVSPDRQVEFAGWFGQLVSNVSGWEGLPEATRHELRNMTVRHFLGARPVYDWPDFVADHPLRLEHPRTGRELLFVTEHHATRILEMDETRSAKVLADLFAHLYAEERRYEHQWRIGDLLIWDNLAIQHARTRPSDPSEGERAMQRVALSEIGLDELVERARARQAA